MAEHYLTGLEHQPATNQLGEPAGIPLDRLRDEYLSYRKPTRKQTTCRRPSGAPGRRFQRTATGELSRDARRHGTYVDGMHGARKTSPGRRDGLCDPLF